MAKRRDSAYVETALARLAEDQNRSSGKSA